MKWIGQHIWDYISRFRNDIYLENNSSLYSNSDGLGDINVYARNVNILNDQVDSGSDTTSGDPRFRLGSSTTECFELTANYATSTKNMQIAVFKTLTDSATANDGRFRFVPDGTAVLEIDDGGIDFYSGLVGGISFNGTDVLTDNGSGTTTLANIDALDATTISTISSAISAGDITGVTITTDSGGGSAASDTGGSADFSILGSNGAGVTNSGTTITVQAVPGEIDHDSLNNYAANEHFTQANITTVGTIGTGVWQGTAIATDYLKHKSTFELAGYSVADGSNYFYSNIMSGNKAPFLHDVNIGSDGLTADNPAAFLRANGTVMPYNGTLKIWKGWGASNGTPTVNIAIFKYTPTADDASNDSLVLVKNTQITGAGNDNLKAFSETSFSVTVAAGDILITAMKGTVNAKTAYFVSTVEIEWTS